MDILFHCLEYYRVNYGHQIIVSGNFHDKFIKDSQLVLEESLFKGSVYLVKCSKFELTTDY